MTPRPPWRHLQRGLAAALSLCLLLGGSLAQADQKDRDRDGSDRRDDRGSERHAERGPDRRNDRDGYRDHERARVAPPPRMSVVPARVDSQRWFDGAHGHNRHYPRPGWAVHALPPHSSITYWGGVRYNHFDGVWYTGGPRGYVVVRPPIGIVVTDRPALASLLVIGGLSYLYANGVYYREQPGVGYEVVPPPVEGVVAGAPPKSYVYPRHAQGAEQQATDEYECHKWAVLQTGFDPTGAALGDAGGGGAPARRGDYERARGACLEGRGYTVR
ncbi:MAG: hypothetical protein C0505_00925 [Leptothrix sp. (in: Bacteria)]|nr:hypothetical protein [Leptothrix sp. (in: b-proteobacteria)]